MQSAVRVCGREALIAPGVRAQQPHTAGLMQHWPYAGEHGLLSDTRGAVLTGRGAAGAGSGGAVAGAGGKRAPARSGHPDAARGQARCPLRVPAVPRRAWPAGCRRVGARRGPACSCQAVVLAMRASLHTQGSCACQHSGCDKATLQPPLAWPPVGPRLMARPGWALQAGAYKF